MSDVPPPGNGASRSSAGRRSPARLPACCLGAASLGLFFVPLLTPLLQAATLIYVLRAAWRGEIDRIGVIAGAGGAGLGFLLFLALQLVWIV